MPTTSLWGVTAKWPTRTPKTKLILCPRDQKKERPYHFEPVRQDFERSGGTSCQLRHAVFHGVCEISLTEVLTTQMGMMQHSKKVSSFELYKLNPLSPHCRSIAWKLVHCYPWGRLRIDTVRGNIMSIMCKKYITSMKKVH